MSENGNDLIPAAADDILRIRIFGEPVLRRSTKSVDNLDQEIMDLISKMLQTMYQAPGVGLAAPQVGVSFKLCVLDVGEGSLTLINPEIVEFSDDTFVFEEGCLSFPEITAEVIRPATVRLKADTLLSNGKVHEDGPFEKDFDGLLARVIQHEIDHLNGKLFVDHLSPGLRLSLEGKLKKLKKQSKKLMKESKKTSR
ncbi:MAG: peptide deformylase [bacterium]|nr:peptide deformylase [bacterium]